MSSVCCLLKTKPTKMQKAITLTVAWGRQRRKRKMGWIMRHRKREKHQKGQTNWEVEMQTGEEWEMYWNEWRPLKISRWIIPLINASAFRCGAQPWCLCVWLYVCLYAVLACACRLHPLQSGTHWNHVFKAENFLLLDTWTHNNLCACRRGLCMFLWLKLSTTHYL